MQACQSVCSEYVFMQVSASMKILTCVRWVLCALDCMCAIVPTHASVLVRVKLVGVQVCECVVKVHIQVHVCAYASVHLFAHV